jgi:hypothetical protein
LCSYCSQWPYSSSLSSHAVDATTSKLVGISNLTPSSEAIIVPYVSIIINKQDTTNQNNNMAHVVIAITFNPKPIVYDVRV